MKHYQVRFKSLVIIIISAMVLSGCAVGGAASPLGTAAGQSTATSAAPQTGTTPVSGPANPSQPVTVLETGSSLLYPLFNQWAPAIKQAYPNLTVETASTGSGTGIAQAVSGVVQIGASDAYMSDSQLAASPGILNIPLAISAQQINFNLPGVSSLNLSGTVLAGIYTGNIQYWDDPAIRADNPNANLPHEKIIPVHRTDGSGDTFIFTQYLSDSDANWNNSIGFNTSINWPAVSGAIGAVGNSGVVQTLAQTQYSIGYVGISFLEQANSKGLGTAALKNQAGVFVMPTSQNISAAASAMLANTPADERISLVFAPGADSYPIINYEYAIVNARQSNPAMASAVRTVLLWAISPNGGNSASFLDTVHFLPLPSSVASKSEAQINQIQ
jgi:phosphate transport system substrate-binding protein